MTNQKIAIFRNYFAATFLAGVLLAAPLTASADPACCDADAKPGACCKTPAAATRPAPTSADAAGSNVTLAASPLAMPRVEGEVHSLDLFREGSTIHALIGVATKGVNHPSPPMFFYARLTGSTWSSFTRVDAGSPAPAAHHRGADARIAARGDDLVAVWTTPGTGAMGTGPLATAVSHDGGKTWTSGPNPAPSSTPGGDADDEHGYRFTALAVDDRAFHLVWLDALGSARGVRATRSLDAGRTWAKSAAIDSETCACCWNAVVVGRDGRVAALYRDTKPSDMSLAVSRDGGAMWGEPVKVGSFGWVFEGCPHTGGALAVTGRGGRAGGEVLHTAVWTGQAGVAGVYALRSEDWGATWSRPQRLGGRGAQHMDLVAGQDDSLAAAWDEFADGERAIYASVSLDGGATWSAAKRVSEKGTQATHPRVVSSKGVFGVVWTQAGGTVKSALRGVTLKLETGRMAGKVE